MCDDVEEAIHVVPLDGGEARLFASDLGDPEALQFDVARDSVYFTNKSGDVIHAIDANGVKSSILGALQAPLLTGLNRPKAIAIHEDSGRIFWIEFDKIQSADFDGGLQEDVIVSGINNGEGLALDKLRGQMYWTDSSTTLKRANLDGSESMVILDADVEIEGVLVGL